MFPNQPSSFTGLQEHHYCGTSCAIAPNAILKPLPVDVPGPSRSVPADVPGPAVSVQADVPSSFPVVRRGSVRKSQGPYVQGLSFPDPPDPEIGNLILSL